MGYYAKHRSAGSKHPVLRAVATSTALVLLVLAGTVFLTYRHLEGNITVSDGFEQIVEWWLPLTWALNQINRSMGHPDMYPFVLPAKVLEKIKFVHNLVMPQA